MDSDKRLSYNPYKGTCKYLIGMNLQARKADLLLGRACHFTGGKTQGAQV